MSRQWMIVGLTMLGLAMSSRSTKSAEVDFSMLSLDI